jgi:hypothetical protein
MNSNGEGIHGVGKVLLYILIKKKKCKKGKNIALTTDYMNIQSLSLWLKLRMPQIVLKL